GDAFDGRAVAHADSAGGRATFSVDALSAGGPFDLVRAFVGGVAAGTNAAETRAAVGAPAAELGAAAGLEGAAFVTGLPSENDAAAALAGNTAVSARIAPDRALGLAVLGGGVADDAAAASITFESAVVVQIDTSQLSATGELLVGLLDPIA